MRSSLTMGHVTLDCDNHETVDSDRVFHLKVENRYNHVDYTTHRDGEDIKRTMMMTISMGLIEAQVVYRLLGLALDSMNRKPGT